MKCPKCGHMADPFATKCPNCGPLDQPKSGKQPAPVKQMKVPELADTYGEVEAAPARPAKRSLLPGLSKGEKSVNTSKPVAAGTAPSGGTSFLSGLLGKLQPKAKAPKPAEHTGDDDFAIDEPL